MNVSSADDLADVRRHTYSIVIPVYNEEDVIASLLDELRSFANGWQEDYELLLVDDGSSDRTASIALDRFANWSQGKLIRLSHNSGQAAALYYGMKCAQGKIVVLMDGDGQNDPRDIPRVLAPLDQCDMVVGIRVNRQDSFIRRKMSHFANAVRGRILKDGVSYRHSRSVLDFHCGRCPFTIGREREAGPNTAFASFCGGPCLICLGSGGFRDGAVRW